MDASLVGSRTVVIGGDGKGRAMSLTALYPSNSLAQVTPYGPYPVDLAVDGTITPGHYRLVIISHGNGGSGRVLYTTAAALARRGFIVMLPDHPGNTTRDNSLAGTYENLQERPRDITRVIDWAFADDFFASTLLRDGVGIVGHSMGGYSALAAAGGRATSKPQESPDGQPHRVEVGCDKRIAGLVLLAPATAWFSTPDALHDVCVPILMLGAEHDDVTPAWQAERVLCGVADRAQVEYHIIPNAGHFSFLIPFPTSMVRHGFPPALDPAGFDRATFNPAMNERIAVFLRAVLPGITRAERAPTT